VSTKRTKVEPLRRLLTITEAGVYLGRSPWATAGMLRAGKLPFVRDGKRKLLDLRDLDAWIDGNKFIEHDSGTLPYKNND